jgi:hypothetical protein
MQTGVSLHPGFSPALNRPLSWKMGTEAETFREAAKNLTKSAIPVSFAGFRGTKQARHF